MSEKHSFWSTIPGMLTGIAAIITAIGGLLLAMHQTGFLDSNKSEEPSTIEIVANEAEPASEQTQNNSAKSQNGKNKESSEDDMVGDDTASRTGNPQSSRINLLYSDNGGQVLAATSDSWLETIDGEERGSTFYESNLGNKTEAVFAFKGESSAEFDTFTVLITGAEDSNLKDFELFWGNESVSGEFHSIGRFETQNIKLFQTRYQEFIFSPVTAKYLKVRLLSTWAYSLINVREFQLWGSLR